MKTFWTVGLASLAFLTPGLASAQQAPPTRTQNPPAARQATPADTEAAPPAQDVRHAASADQQIAGCLAISNEEEIALAKLAEQHAQSQEVKQFAQRLIQDHEKFLAELRRFSGTPVAATERAAPGERLARRAADAIARANPVLTPSQRTAAREVGGLDFLAIKREMAQKCEQSAQKQWSEKAGHEADMCYAGQQLVMHYQMRDALEVFERHASPELQAVIQKGISATNEHLQEAERLVKQLAAAESNAPNRDRTSEKAPTR